MKVRVITAIIGLPFLILPIYFGGISLYLLFLMISCVGFYELLRAYQIKEKFIIILSLLTTVGYYGMLWLNQSQYFGLLIAVFLVILLLYYIFAYPKIQLQTIAIIFTGFFYVTYLITHILLIREINEFGLPMVWLVFLIGFGSDTFAYLVGKTVGKHKLVPRLSPNKTIEGAVGGICGAMVLAVAYGYIMHLNGNSEVLNKLGWLAILGAVGSIVSQAGDLVASAIKRQTGIKDFGQLLPGHGGILDRFDSNIFAAPFVYYIMTLFII